MANQRYENASQSMELLQVTGAACMKPCIIISLEVATNATNFDNGAKFASVFGECLTSVVSRKNVHKFAQLKKGIT